MRAQKHRPATRSERGRSRGRISPTDCRDYCYIVLPRFRNFGVGVGGIV